jgi:DNA-directed RNA polymerase specialized sigma24 family protein
VQGYRGLESLPLRHYKMPPRSARLPTFPGADHRGRSSASHRNFFLRSPSQIAWLQRTLRERPKVWRMNEEPTHLSLGEVRRALDRLRPPDIVRLSELARHWASGLRGYDADDILNEAFERILAGRRPWPHDVSTPAFLSGVMRSIASEWRHRATRERLLEDEEDGATESIPGGLGPNHEINDVLFRMRRALAEDSEALEVLEHILADSDRDDAQDASGLDATQYETARRRMLRRMFAAFSSGWKL